MKPVDQIKERYKRLMENPAVPDKTAPAFSIEEVGTLLTFMEQMEGAMKTMHNRYMEHGLNGYRAGVAGDAFYAGLPKLPPNCS